MEKHGRPCGALEKKMKLESPYQGQCPDIIAGFCVVSLTDPQIPHLEI